MTASTYRQGLSLVLAHEGGFVNHPKDPGGPTNQGVTQRVYDAYRKVHGLPLQSVKSITSGEVTEIYQKQYWNLVKGDDLPPGLDYAVFDFAVNSGIARAVRYLQRTVKVADDGIIGNATLAAVYESNKAGATDLIGTYCNNRMAFLRSLNTFPTFGKGWTRRVCGSILGAQPNDTGVVDFAYNMSLAAAKAVIPVVEKLPPAVPAKAFSDDYNSWPMAEQNDYLAKLIEAS